MDDDDNDDDDECVPTSPNLQGTVECAGPNLLGTTQYNPLLCCSRAPIMPRESSLSVKIPQSIMWLQDTQDA